MELLHKTQPKRIGGRSISMGLFLCQYCKGQVERDLSNGTTNRSCGCRRWKQQDKEKRVRKYDCQRGEKECAESENADRVCLKCNTTFDSASKYNRLCPDCALENKKNRYRSAYRCVMSHSTIATISET